MREERDRIRERRNVKPKYKIVREEIRKEKFVYDFIYRKNGKIVRTSSAIEDSLFQTANFTLTKDIAVDDGDDDDNITIDDNPPKKPVPELLVLTPDGNTDYYGAVINGTGVRRINSSTFKGKGGTSFSVTLRAKDPLTIL